MPDHYFTSRPASPHRPGEFAADLGGRRMVLATDAGVFSREGIDAGTRLLLKALTVRPDARRLVDLGCGYGPIGLALAGSAPEAEVFCLTRMNGPASLPGLMPTVTGLAT